MASTVLLTQDSAGGYSVSSASTNLFFHLGTAPHLAGDLSFTSVQNRFRTAGTFSNLQVVVPTNNRSTACVVSTAQGATPTAGNLTVTIPATTTGTFEDPSNSDTVSAGEDWGYRLTRTTATGGTACVITQMSVVFTTSVVTIRPTVNFEGGNPQSFGTTRYWSIMGYGGTSTIAATTESDATFYTPCAGTYRNGYLRVSANTLNGSLTATLRKNAFGTAVTFTVPSTTTGTFEDSSNSATAAVGDLVAWDYTTAGTSGNLTFRTSGIDFVSDGDDWFTGSYGSTSGNLQTLAVGNTRYTSVGGFLQMEAAEADAQTNARLALTATKIGIKVGGATNGAGTMTFRVGGADTTLSVSIPANTSGWHIATGLVELDPSDLQSLKLVHGGSGANLTYRQVFVLYEGSGRKYIAAFGLDEVAHSIDQSNFFGVWANFIKFNDAWLNFKEVSLTNAEIKALRATPKELVAAPGAGKLLEFVSLMLLLDYGGTNVFTETADNLQVKYENGSGQAVSETIETTGFIDQSADTMTTGRPKLDQIVAKTGCENKALVLHNTGDGEIAGNAANNNTMRARIAYRIWSTGW